MIEKTTRLFGLLGDNLAQDKTPQIVNALFGANDLDAACVIFNIREEDLPFTLRGMRKSQMEHLDIDGIYESAAAGLADRLEGDALRLGIVDTLKVADGELVGEMRVFRDLCEARYDAWRNKRVVVTGETARRDAAIVALAAIPGVRITVATPYLEEALEATASLGIPVEFIRYAADVPLRMEAFDILIHTGEEGVKGLDAFVVPAGLGADHTVVTVHKTALPSYLALCARDAGAMLLDGYDLATIKGAATLTRIFGIDPAVPADIRECVTEDFTRYCQLTKGLTHG